MTTTMDIAVCLDCSLSITFHLNQIRRIILSILKKAVVCHDTDVRMSLIEFRSHTDELVTDTCPFTSSMNTFQEYLNGVRTDGGNSDECKAVVDGLDACLRLQWRPNTDANRYHEKLVILITDGAPCRLLSDTCPWDNKDLWRISDEFLKEDITLAVIGIEPSIVVCDDFYCALANKTGGEYLPLINASRVLSSVIQRAILEEYTLSQLFHRLDIQFDIEYNSLYNYSSVQKRARFMIEHCRTMVDIRRHLFTYRHQSPEFIIDRINVNDDYRCHSPLLNMHAFDHLPRSDVNSITSTPRNDDEGYRTRLPTTASADSSFLYINGSPVLSDRPNMDCFSEIDDECF